MKLNELLSQYGFSEKDINRIITKRGRSSSETAQERIEQLKKFFNLSDSELISFINDAPNLLGSDILSDAPTSIKNKTEYYKKTFHLSDEGIKKFIISFPALLTYDVVDRTENPEYISKNNKSEHDTTVPEKIRFYQSVLMLSDEETLKFIKRFPMLLGYDIYSNKPSSIQSKLNFYKSLLQLDDSEIATFIKKLPQLLSYDLGIGEEHSQNPSAITSKYEFYKNTLNLTDEQLNHVIKQFPFLLSYDTVSNNPKSVKEKLAFYQRKLNLTDEELHRFISEAPCALGYDTLTNLPTSANAKIDKLLEIGTIEDIKKNPRCLCLPAQKVKIRAMLISDLVDDLIGSNNLMIREQKLYARRTFFENRNIPVTWTELFRNEREFEKVYNVSSEVLMQIYPLTKDVLKKIEEDYNKHAKRKLTLSEDEKIAILGAEE